MTSKTWSGGGTTSNPHSGAWGTKTNWSPAGVPAAGDDIIIAGSGPFTVAVSCEEIAFIDGGISDLGTMLAGLRDDVEAIVLERSKPATAQIVGVLKERGGIEAIHIVAHGRPGEVCLDTGALSIGTLDEHSADLKAIGSALGASGEILLWSCETGQGGRGAAFVAGLERMTGAHVATASGLIGSSARGGTWELTAHGSVPATQPPLTAAGMAGYAGVLATKTWKTTGTTAWATAANWNPASVPGSTDDIVINSGGTQPTISNSTDTTISSLTVGSGATLTFTGTEILTLKGAGSTKGLSNSGTIALGSSTITVTSASGAIVNNGTISISGGTLSDSASGVTNSGAPAKISGYGTLTGAVTNSSSATIAVTGGNMTANGGITNSATITIASGDKLSSNSGAFTNNTGGTISISGTGILTDTLGSGTGINNAGGTITIGAGTVSSTGTSTISNNGGGTISISGGTLSSGSGGITNTGASSNISGYGKLTGALTNSSGGTLAVTGGNMTANSGITNSAAITIASGDTLSSTTTITDKSGGTIIISGGNLSSSGGGGIVNNSGATISGYGTVGGAVSGTGTITASGGTLDLTGAVASGPVFTIATGSASTLEFSGTATAAAPIAINNIYQTLQVASSGKLTINGGAESITNGTISLSGGTLTDSTGISVGSGATLTGYGTLTGAVTNNSGGTLAVTGGNMTANGGITNSATITIASGDKLSSNSGAFTNNTGGTISISGTGILTDTLGSGTGINNAGGTITIGAGTVSSTGTSTISNNGGGTISISGGTLSSGSGGITNTGASSNISGYGKLTGALTNSSGGTLAVTGGNMTANSGITNSAAITIASGDTLSSTTTITDKSGGTIIISGGNLSSSGGGGIVNNSGATISGYGTVGGAVSGTGAITASGGTLDLTGKVASGPAFTISSASASILEFAAAATSAGAITINNANQTLEIGSGGALTLSAAENITNGTIQLAGGTLTDTSGLAIGSGAHLNGFGAVKAGTTAAKDVDGAGGITANGGTLEFKTLVDGTAASAFDIADVTGSLLKFDAAVGTASIKPVITFDGADGGVGTLDLTSVTLANFHGVVANFLDGDQIKVANATTATLDSTGTILTVFNGSTALGSITLSTSHTGDTFTVNGGTISVVGPPAAADSTITASPSSVTADGVSDTMLTVTVKDALGNPVVGTAVTLSASGSDNAFGSLSGTTDASGVFSTTLASTLAQTETITATEGSAQETANVTFVTGAPAAANSTITASPSSVTADGVSDTMLTVTVKDALGNPVVGTAVTLSASGSDNAFGSLSGTTNASGVFTTTLASTLAQSETITATEGSVHETTNVTFVAGPPAAADSTITASPTSLTADGVSATTLTVKVEDAQGNPVGGSAVTLSANGSDNAFGTTSGTTNANGVFATTLTSTVAQTETITATEGSAQETTNVTFVAGPPSSAKSTITASPASLRADGTSPTTLTVKVEDAQGNPVAGTAVTLSASGSDNTFGSISATTNANGVFTTTLASTLAQTETVTATEGSAQETTTVIFAAGAPSASTSTITANPTTETANGTAATTLTVTVEDAQGNPVGGSAVTLSASGSDNSFGSISGTTNASGVFTTTLASTLAQTETVTATEGSAQETTTVTFATPPAGTSTADQYVWGSAIAGSWDVAGNWDDTTAGQTPASVAPGSNDIVTIGAAGGSATHVITGVGDSASLTIEGATVLSGQFATGALTVGEVGTAGSAQLNAGNSLSVSGDASIQRGSALTADAGGLTIGGDASLFISSSLNIGGGTAATIGGDLDSYNSSVDVSSGGSLMVSGDYAATIDDTATINAGSMTVDGSVGTSDGGLTLIVENGGALSIADYLSDVPYNENNPSPPFPFGDLTLTVLSNSTATVGDITLTSGSDTFNINGGTLTVGGITTTTSEVIFTVQDSGKLVVTGNDVDDFSSYQVSDGTFTVGGTLTASGTTIAVSSGGLVQLAGLSGSDHLTVDGSSSLEVGTAGGVATGSITIDSGVTADQSGSFTAPKIVDDGTLVATGNLSLNGSLGGSGQIAIDSGGNLTVEGAAAASNSTTIIAFTGTGSVLTIEPSALNASDDFTPTIGGFNASDAIDYGGTVTSASYANGFLTLSDGNTAVAQLNLEGNYAGQTFISLPISSNLTQINVIGAGDTSTAPSGTSTADQYVWGSAIAGSWDVAGNWDDTTAGQTPASVAPGSNDIVTIGAAGGGATHVITGVGDSASLTIEGATVLSGQFATGALTVGEVGTAGSAQLNAGNSLSVSGDASIQRGSALTADAGGLTIGGDASLFISSSLNIGGGTAATIGGDLDSYNSSVDVSSGGSLMVSGDYAATIDDTATINAGSMTVDGSVGTSDGGLTLIVENGGALSIADYLSDVPYNENNPSPPFPFGDLTLTVLSNSTATVGDITLTSGSDTFNINGGTLTVGGITTTTSEVIFTVQDSGKLVVTGNDVDDFSSYQVSDGTFTVGGTLTASGTTIAVSSGGLVQLAGLSGSDHLTVDGSSSLEVGTAGGVATGSITINSGVTADQSGSFTAPKIVDDGTLVATGNLSLNGSLGGSGQIAIDSGGNLTVEGAAAASNSTTIIAFTGTGSVLTIEPSALNASDDFTPTIGGFNASDAIDYGGTVTSASYANGFLTLSDGNTAVAQLNLEGNYAGQTFISLPISSNLTQINVIGAGDTSTAPSGTSTADQYVWGSAIAGSWDVAGNWDDTTAGQTPASVAPGSNDIVTIGAAGGSATHVITGVGDSASLTIEGATVLSGQFATGALTVGEVGTAGSAQLNAGNSLSVSGDASIQRGSALTADAGGLTIGGDASLFISSSLNIGGGTAATIGGDLDSYNSSVDVSSGGSLMVSGDYAATIDDTATINAGSMTVDGSVGTSDGGLTLIVENGGALSIADYLSDVPYNENNPSPPFPFGDLTLTVLSNSTATVGDITLTSGSDTFNINGGTLTVGGITTTTSEVIFTVQDSGKLVVTGNDVDDFSSYQVSDGTFTVGGTLTASGTTIAVSSGGLVQLAGLSGSDHLTVDGSSSLEVGTAGGVATGSITIDSGVTTTVSGAFNAPSIIDNGTLVVAAGGSFTLNGLLGGSGQIDVGNGGNLIVENQAATASAPTITLEGSNDNVTLYSSAFNASQQFTPTLIGLNASDVIDYEGTVTSATPTYNGTNTTLTLYDNSTVVGTLTLSGNYSGDTFTTTEINSNLTQIVDPPAPTGTIANGTDPPAPAVTIANGANFEISSASADEVTFASITGQLQLDHSQSFAGTVAGFGNQDQIDLRDIAFSANTTLGYSTNGVNGGGTMTASDGVDVAKIAVLGQYAASSFVMASDGHGGTLITEAPQLMAQTQLTHPHA